MKNCLPTENSGIDEAFSVLKSEQDFLVKEQAFVYLLNQKSERVVKLFIELLSSHDASLRSMAIEAIQHFGVEYGKEVKKLLYGDDDDLKIMALSVIAGFRADYALSVVREYIQSVLIKEEKENENVLASALDILVDLGAREDVELLKSLGKKYKSAGCSSYLMFVFKKAEEALCGK